MLAKIYQNNILGNPKSVLLILVSILFLSIYFSKDFRLDASSETLLLDGDPDLKYLNEINNRYGAKEFLVLTYSPKNEMISESSIKNLLSSVSLKLVIFPKHPISYNCGKIVSSFFRILGCIIPISLLDFILSLIISMYLGSKIFKGTLVFGKIIKLLNGKIGTVKGKSSFFILFKLYHN